MGDSTAQISPRAADHASVTFTFPDDEGAKQSPRQGLRTGPAQGTSGRSSPAERKLPDSPANEPAARRPTDSTPATDNTLPPPWDTVPHRASPSGRPLHGSRRLHGSAASPPRSTGPSPRPPPQPPQPPPLRLMPMSRSRTSFIDTATAGSAAHSPSHPPALRRDSQYQSFSLANYYGQTLSARQASFASPAGRRSQTNLSASRFGGQSDTVGGGDRVGKGRGRQYKRGELLTKNVITYLARSVKTARQRGDLLIHLLMLVFLMIMLGLTKIEGNTSPSFFVHSGVKDMALGTAPPEGTMQDFPGAWGDVSNDEQFWGWAHGFVDRMWAPGFEVAGQDQSGIQSRRELFRLHNIPLAYVLFYQIRRGVGDCESAAPFLSPLTGGYLPQTCVQEDVDNGRFGPSGMYRSNEELSGSGLVTHELLRSKIYAERYRYGSIGERGKVYIQLLNVSRTAGDIHNQVATLQRNGWFDGQTMVVGLEWFVFNPAQRFFVRCQVFAEISATGEVRPQYYFLPFTAESSDLRTATGYVVLVLDILILIFVLIEGYGLVVSILGNRELEDSWRNTIGLWECVNVVNIGLFIANYYYRFRLLHATLQPSSATATDESMLVKLVDFANDYNNNNVYQSLNIGLSWLRLFQYLQFDSRLNVLSETIKQAGGELMALIVISLVIFMAFAFSGHLLYGATCHNFRDFGRSFGTLLRFIYGDGPYEQDAPCMYHTHSMATSIFLFTFLVIVWLVLLNLVLAIITGSFQLVQESMEEPDWSFETLLADARWAARRVLRRLRRALGLKKKRKKKRSRSPPRDGETTVRLVGDDLQPNDGAVGVVPDSDRVPSPARPVGRRASLLRSEGTDDLTTSDSPAGPAALAPPPPGQTGTPLTSYMAPRTSGGTHPEPPRLQLQQPSTGTTGTDGGDEDERGGDGGNPAEYPAVAADDAAPAPSVKGATFVNTPEGGALDRTYSGGENGIAGGSNGNGVDAGKPAGGVADANAGPRGRRRSDPAGLPPLSPTRQDPRDSKDTIGDIPPQSPGGTIPQVSPRRVSGDSGVRAPPPSSPIIKTNTPTAQSLRTVSDSNVATPPQPPLPAGEGVIDLDKELNAGASPSKSGDDSSTDDDDESQVDLDETMVGEEIVAKPRKLTLKQKILLIKLLRGDGSTYITEDDIPRIASFITKAQAVVLIANSRKLFTGKQQSVKMGERLAQHMNSRLVEIGCVLDRLAEMEPYVTSTMPELSMQVHAGFDYIENSIGPGLAGLKEKLDELHDAHSETPHVLTDLLAQLDKLKDVSQEMGGTLKSTHTAVMSSFAEQATMATDLLLQISRLESVPETQQYMLDHLMQTSDTQKRTTELLLKPLRTNLTDLMHEIRKNNTAVAAAAATANANAGHRPTSAMDDPTSSYERMVASVLETRGRARAHSQAETVTSVLEELRRTPQRERPGTLVAPPAGASPKSPGKLRVKRAASASASPISRATVVSNETTDDGAKDDGALPPPQ